MRRREFITLLSGAVALWSQAARAQNPGGVRRIGVLLSLAETDPEGKAQLSGFTQGLAELGWIDGRNLQMEIRWGRGDIDRIRTFAKELVVLQPDVILSHGTPVTAALHRETRTIPIVFVTVSDPVGDGFVAGLPHPGGNITGFLTSESTITAKMFELLTEIAPGLKRVAILFNPDTAQTGTQIILNGDGLRLQQLTMGQQRAQFLAAQRNFGLKVGVVGTVKFETRIEELVENIPDLVALVEPMLVVRRVLREQINILHRRLLAIVRDDEVCRRLMTVPGVGSVVAPVLAKSKYVVAHSKRDHARRRIHCCKGLRSTAAPLRSHSGTEWRSGYATKCCSKKTGGMNP